MARGAAPGRSAQEALSDPGRECGAAAPTPRPGTAPGKLGRTRVGAGGDACFGAVAGPCNQWSIARAARGTLMRHDVCAVHHRRRQGIDRVVADAPAPRARRMGHAPASAALVASTRLALRGLARQARTRGCAVALTAVAMAAQQDLDKATCTEEQAGGIVHAHTSDPSPRCWTGASQRATLWSHRLHRHGVGRGAVDQPPSDGPLPRPTYFGIVERCTTLGSVAPQASRAGSRQTRSGNPSGPTHQDRLRPPPGGDQQRGLRLPGRPPGGQAGEELMRAAAPSRNHRLKRRQSQNRALTAE